MCWDAVPSCCIQAHTSARVIRIAAPQCKAHMLSIRQRRRASWQEAGVRANCPLSEQNDFLRKIKQQSS